MSSASNVMHSGNSMMHLAQLQFSHLNPKPRALTYEQTGRARQGLCRHADSSKVQSPSENFRFLLRPPTRAPLSLASKVFSKKISRRQINYHSLFTCGGRGDPLNNTEARIQNPARNILSLMMLFMLVCLPGESVRPWHLSNSHNDHAALES